MALLLIGSSFVMIGLGLVLINDDHEGEILREEYRVYRRQMNVPVLHEIAFRPIHDELMRRETNQKKPFGKGFRSQSFDSTFSKSAEDYILVEH